MSKHSYAVRSPVKFQGAIIKEGTIECEPEEVIALVKSGSLAPADGTAAAAVAVAGQQQSSASEGDDEITMEVFLEAVAHLDQNNKKHWTKGGLPDLKALDKVGLKLTAKERDELWATSKAQEVEGWWVRAKEGVVKLEGLDYEIDTDGMGFALDGITDEQLKALQEDDLLIVERGTFGGLVSE